MGYDVVAWYGPDDCVVRESNVPKLVRARLIAMTRSNQGESISIEVHGKPYADPSREVWMKGKPLCVDETL